MIETERLLQREWRDEDRATFAAINADPRVREFFPTLLTREESDASIDRFQESQRRNGFCFWAAEMRDLSAMIGFIGLQEPSFQLPGTSESTAEIGWRLAPEVWGQGLATEGARAALRFAFEKIRMAQVVAITVPKNVRSRRVMEKLGMRHNPKENFEHPGIAEGHSLRPHVLYRLERTWWPSLQQNGKRR